jgi:hypothetical protein
MIIPDDGPPTTGQAPANPTPEGFGPVRPMMELKGRTWVKVADDAPPWALKAGTGLILPDFRAVGAPRNQAPTPAQGEPPADSDSDPAAWAAARIADGLDPGAIVALIPDNMPHTAVTVVLRELKRAAGLSIGDGRALLKAARELRRASHAAEAEADNATAAEAIKANRTKWVNRIRAAGGRTMPDTSTRDIEYFVLPAAFMVDGTPTGHLSFKRLLNDLTLIPDDAETDSLLSRPERTGEPRGIDRVAWIIGLNRGDAEARPTEIRRIPRPIYAVLHDSTRYHIVYTPDDKAPEISPEDVERGTGWLTKSAFMAATGLRMQDIVREAFRRLADECPVILRTPRLDETGHIALLPRGAVPTGWRDIAPGTDRETALSKWKQVMGIAERSPGGIAAHVFGAAVDGYYLGYGRRQGHTLDVHGYDTNTGKTSMLAAVGAMIGNPDSPLVVMTADFASKISVGAFTSQISYGTLPLDETQMFGRTPREHGDLCLSLAQGGVRGRSGKDGTTATANDEFYGVVIMTGNIRFVPSEVIAQELPALNRRYLPISVSGDNPVFASNLDATSVRDLSRESYGWFIPLIVESMTSAAHEANVREIWAELISRYPDENTEVLRLLAGHLAGCRAIDRLLGTSLEYAAMVSVTDQITDVNHKSVNTGIAFVRAARDHVQENSGKWLYPDEWIAIQTRGPDSDNVLGVDREVYGLRARDGSWFAAFGAKFLKLCGESGNLDPETVRTDLDKSGLLKRTNEDRGNKTFTTQVPLGSVNGRQYKPRLYHLLTSWHHDADQPNGDDSGGGEPIIPPPAPASPGPGASGPITDPFASAPAALIVQAAEPDRATESIAVIEGSPEHADTLLSEIRAALHLDRECPTCKAGFSEPCHTASGAHLQQAHVSRSEAAPAAEPASAAWVRPDWIPSPLRKTINAEGKPVYGGVVKAFNTLWDRQAIRGRAQIHNHPYPDDDDVPAPLRLIGKNLGTGVHEGKHNYTNPAIPAGTPVTVLDRNAAYLSAIGAAVLPIDGLYPFDGPGDGKLTGIYHVESWPQMIGECPHPWGVLRPILDKRELWVSRATLDIGRELSAAGLMGEPRVIESLLGRRLKQNMPATARLEKLYGMLRDARATGLESGDDDAVGFVKAVYSVGISTMGESGSNNRIWRPELPLLIRGTAFANNYRLARKFTAVGLALAALRDTDAIHIAASPDTIFATGVIARGRGLSEIKVKGGYIMGENGNAEPGTEWSNDHA